MKLMDSVEWKQGMMVYWFTIYKRLNDVGFNVTMYNAVPTELIEIEGSELAHFVFDKSIGGYSQYGYYGSHTNAILALHDALKLAYETEITRQLQVIDRLKKLANDNLKSLTFNANGMMINFAIDETELLQLLGK